MTSQTRAELITSSLTPMLGMLQGIEAWNHPGLHTSSTTVQFPYGNWLASPAPLYYQNGTIITPTSTDTDLGTATISSLAAGDDIHANYTFKYFTTTELEYFYDLAMSKFNNAAPTTSFTFSNYPSDVQDFLTKYAYKLCLQRVLTDMLTWKGRLIWTDPVQLSSILQGIMGGLSAEIGAELPNIKGRRFLLMRAVSSGRFTVPATVDSNFQRFTIIRA